MSRRKGVAPPKRSAQPDPDPQEPELLTDEEFDRALRDFTLGSHPERWDAARDRLWRDRVLRTRAPSEGSDLADALLWEDHRDVLLRKALEQLPPGELADEIRACLENQP